MGRKRKKQKSQPQGHGPAATKTIEPDWTHECDNCGERPVVPDVGLCGPCTFGEAKTYGGNW